MITLVAFGSVLESNAIYWGSMMMSDNIADIDDYNSIRDASSTMVMRLLKLRIIIVVVQIHLLCLVW